MLRSQDASLHGTLGTLIPAPPASLTIPTYTVGAPDQTTPCRKRYKRECRATNFPQATT